MEQERHLTFGPFHFDVTQDRLWQGDQSIILRPQTLAMLRYLVEYPGRLGTESRVAAAHVGGHARHQYGAAGGGARGSPGVG
jgi:DNA-binding response OmpR family regulator